LNDQNRKLIFIAMRRTNCLLADLCKFAFLDTVKCVSCLTVAQTYIITRQACRILHLVCFLSFSSEVAGREVNFPWIRESKCS